MKKKLSQEELERIANEIRKDIIEQLYHAGSGHPGGSLSAADLLAVLYFDKMNIDPQNPNDPDRDRFVLSKGHAAPVLYAALAERGYFPKEDLKTLRKINSYLQGHPDMKHTPGVDMSSGSLGQGISAAVGMALAGKIDDKDYTVYTLLGDGEAEEGQVWEAAMFAGNNELDNLIVFIDHNGLQIDGPIEEVNSPNPLDAKFDAFKFETQIVEDGNDIGQISKAIEQAQNVKGRPSAIILETVKGKGVSFMEDQVGWHGKAPNKEEYELAMKELEGNYE